MLVEERILSIQEAFQIGKLEGELSGILSEYQFETALSNEFISVAFEGCSMAIAITSLKNRDSLIDWHLFVSQKGQNYLSQIHVGLGWALAELKLPIQQYLISIDPKWQLRVLDGFGYYCGLFRRREAIRTMSFPTEIPEALYAGFNQGIGRFLFYLAQGDVERLSRNIELFADNRHADFWRGIGIAATFIGLESTDTVNALFDESGEHSKQFAVGIALAAVSIGHFEHTISNSQLVINELTIKYPNFISHIQQLDSKNERSFVEYVNALIYI